MTKPIKKIVSVVRKPYIHHRVAPRPVSWSAPPFWERGLKRETYRAKAQRERENLVECARLRRALRDLDPAGPLWRGFAGELRDLQEGLGLTPSTDEQLVTLGEAALSLSRDVTVTAAVQLSASAQFRAIAKQLAIATSRTAAAMPEPQKKTVNERSARVLKMTRKPIPDPRMTIK